jgi:hypothetical protein
MAGESITRRRFLFVAGVVIGGSLGAGGAWLLRSDGDRAAVTPPTTSPSTTTVTTATPAPTSTNPSTTAETPATTTTSPTMTAPPAGETIAAICKEAWGAQPVAGGFTSHTIEHITVHHTAVVLQSNMAAPARARQHQSYHQSLGWADLAYHYLVDANGHVYEGRPVGAAGDTATDYDPTGHFLVCCEGDFNSQEITAAQYESLVKLLAWGVAEFGVEASSIRGHRDVAATTCPGDNLHPLIAEGTVAEDVASIVAGGVPELEVLCGPRGAEVVAAIEAGQA